MAEYEHESSITPATPHARMDHVRACALCHSLQTLHYQMSQFVFLNLITCQHVGMITQTLNGFLVNIRLMGAFNGERADLEVNCAHPSLHLSIPSASAVPARRPIIHILFAQPCLQDSCSWEKGKSISQGLEPLCKSAFIDYWIHTLSHVAAQNTENRRR